MFLLSINCASTQYPYTEIPMYLNINQGKKMKAVEKVSHLPLIGHD